MSFLAKHLLPEVDQPHPDALEQMRERGGKWCAYQDHEIQTQYPYRPSLKYLQYGQPHNTFPTVESLPPHYPEGTVSGGCVYLPVGFVDLSTGKITYEEPHLSTEDA